MAEAAGSRGPSRTPGRERSRRRAAGSGPRPDPARSAALDLLVAVSEQDAYANLVWPAILAQHGLADRDARFATELGYGALRWRGRHDAILSACVDRELSSLQPVLRDCLRLGVHQLHEMRVGDHAAVDQTVRLVRARLHPGAAGLANAVLRRVAAGGGPAAWLDRLVGAGAVPAEHRDPAGHLAVATSHPQWIVRAVHEALAGPDAGWADTRAALLADNAAGSVTLVARSIPRDELLARLLEQGVPARAGRWSPLAVRVGSVSPAALPEVATGAAGVQDEGSQLVALLLAAAPLHGTDSRWLDLCAGPGGKAALLAGEVARRGGRLTAVEQHEHRAALVRSALRPVRGHHEVLTGDALDLDLDPGFDRVLVDAPCTGLGALRRRPEARWRRTPGDLAALTAQQRRLLARALGLVRTGGLVLYTTCSPHLAETEAVVGDVRRWGGQVVAPPDLPSLPRDATTGALVRLWPHRHDTDGMFAALIRRTG